MGDTVNPITITLSSFSHISLFWIEWSVLFIIIIGLTGNLRWHYLSLERIYNCFWRAACALAIPDHFNPVCAAADSKLLFRPTEGCSVLISTLLLICIPLGFQVKLGILPDSVLGGPYITNSAPLTSWIGWQFCFAFQTFSHFFRNMVILLGEKGLQMLGLLQWVPNFSEILAQRFLLHC